MKTPFKALLTTLICSVGLTLLVPFAFYSPVKPNAVGIDRLTEVDRRGAAIASDRLTHPPIKQTFQNGPYQLEITAADNWQTPAAIARLTQAGTLLWEQALPQQYGPRYALISSTGQVILFDEYINVASDYAIALISSSGNLTTQYSFTDIHNTLPTLTRADLTRQATSGWWLSAAPTLSEPNNTARIQTGGTTLNLNLNTEELTETQTP